MNVLVTGATGFIGSALVRRLAQEGHTVRAAVRSADSLRIGELNLPRVEVWNTGDLCAPTGWDRALSGIDVVVHSAGRAHVLRERSSDPLSVFRQVNTSGTDHLARAASRNGVRRFVYLSSIHVNGHSTPAGSGFRESDDPSPANPYAISKLEGETALRTIADSSGMEHVILRPPLVYGDGAAGNLASMLRWLRLGVPLPLAGVHNARTLLSVRNLCDVVKLCLTHPAAAGQAFVLGDETPVSTPDILRFVAQGMGTRARLYSLPGSLLALASQCCGLQNAYRRLCHSLVVDSTKARQLLQWQPGVSTKEGLVDLGRLYRMSMQGTPCGVESC